MARATPGVPAGGGKAAVIEEIRRALDTIGDPCSVANGTPMGLQEMGLVGDVRLDDDGNVDIGLRLTSPSCMMVGYFGVEAKKRVQEIPGVRAVEVTADLGLDWTPDLMSAAAKERRIAALRARGIPT
jgi:metal-sulfur cluster biosynthetic enzyme